jgi:coenzyme F420-reducing hydrogenase alpha subunit
MSDGRTRTVKVETLARVEGEGALDVRIRDGVVRELKLRIYEPPRFFEPLLRGRMYVEAPDITSRICGICPIAYILSSSQAMEDILGIRVVGPLRSTAESGSRATSRTRRCCTRRTSSACRMPSSWRNRSASWWSRRWS